MGKGGGGVKTVIGPLEKQQAESLRELEETVARPIRQTVMPGALQTLGGPGVFQTDLPGAERDVIEQQFRQARNATLSGSGARGGQLRQSLVGLERGRAADIGMATNQARQRGVERALGIIGSGLPSYSSVMGAQGNLVSGEQGRNMANAQSKAQAQAANSQAMTSGIAALATTAMMMY